MWRYDRPQKGRYREHLAALGRGDRMDDPAVDAELIQFYDELLSRLGVTGYVLYLNSIGDPKCRPAYVEKLEAWLDEHDSELDEDARAKRSTTPLRVFDVKSEQVQALLAEAPKIGENPATSAASTSSRFAFLDAVGVRYELEPTLVRGLDYYTRTTFEFKDEAIGAQSAICGGGRYDGLIEAIGGPPTPGIGFGAGIERLLLSLGEPELEPEAIDVFFVADEGATAAIAKASSSCAAGDLRRHGLRGPLGQGPADAGGRLNARRSGRRRAGRDAGRRRDREGARHVSWRDEHAGDLRTEDVGRTVTLAGWPRGGATTVA